MDTWKENCKINRLCINCGLAIEAGNNTRHCDKCRKVHNERSTIKTTERRKDKSLCVHCGKPSDKNSCDPCSIKVKTAKKKRYHKNKSMGLCPECGSQPIGNISVCEKHYLSNASKAALKTTKYAKDLKDLFLKQDGKCYYTGFKIEMGVNASLDHRIPVSSGHEDVFKLSNLVWSDLRINKMKNAISEEKFLDICDAVSRNRKKIPRLTMEDTDNGSADEVVSKNLI